MDRSRRARISFGPRTIQELLGLPEGLEVVSVQGQFDPPAIVVIVQGEQLEPVPDGAQSPTLSGYIESETLQISEEAAEAFPELAPCVGKTYRRWGWSTD